MKLLLIDRWPPWRTGRGVSACACRRARDKNRPGRPTERRSGPLREGRPTRRGPPHYEFPWSFPQTPVRLHARRSAGGQVTCGRRRTAPDGREWQPCWHHRSKPASGAAAVHLLTAASPAADPTVPDVLRADPGRAGRRGYFGDHKPGRRAGHRRDARLTGGGVRDDARRGERARRRRAGRRPPGSPKRAGCGDRHRQLAAQVLYPQLAALMSDLGPFRSCGASHHLAAELPAVRVSDAAVTAPAHTPNRRLTPHRSRCGPRRRPPGAQTETPPGRWSPSCSQSSTPRGHHRGPHTPRRRRRPETEPPGASDELNPPINNTGKRAEPGRPPHGRRRPGPHEGRRQDGHRRPDHPPPRWAARNRRGSSSTPRPQTGTRPSPTRPWPRARRHHRRQRPPSPEHRISRTHRPGWPSGGPHPRRTEHCAATRPGNTAASILFALALTIRRSDQDLTQPRGHSPNRRARPLDPIRPPAFG